MTNTISSRKLLSTGEVARLSGFSPSAVLQWIHSGKLRSYSSPGGQHRVDPAELLEFLDEHGMRVPPELRPDDAHDCGPSHGEGAQEPTPPLAASPRRKARQDAAPSPQGTAASGGSPSAAPRVLIVEDDRAVRDVLARILTVSGLGVEVETAESGVEGCVKIPVFEPQLIVLDIEMPVFDGVELCRWVKEAQELKETKLLLLASDPHDERLRVAMLAGADEWMIKPVRVMPFLSTVTQLLGMEAPIETPEPAAAGTREQVAAST